MLRVGKQSKSCNSYSQLCFCYSCLIMKKKKEKLETVITPFESFLRPFFIAINLLILGCLQYRAFNVRLKKKKRSSMHVSLTFLHSFAWGDWGIQKTWALKQHPDPSTASSSVWRGDVLPDPLSPEGGNREFLLSEHFQQPLLKN